MTMGYGCLGAETGACAGSGGVAPLGVAEVAEGSGLEGPAPLATRGLDPRWSAGGGWGLGAEGLESSWISRRLMSFDIVSRRRLSSC